MPSRCEDGMNDERGRCKPEYVVDTGMGRRVSSEMLKTNFFGMKCYPDGAANYRPVEYTPPEKKSRRQGKNGG